MSPCGTSKTPTVNVLATRITKCATRAQQQAMIDEVNKTNMKVIEIKQQNDFPVKLFTTVDEIGAEGDDQAYEMLCNSWFALYINVHLVFNVWGPSSHGSVSMMCVDCFWSCLGLCLVACLVGAGVASGGQGQVGNTDTIHHFRT